MSEEKTGAMFGSRPGNGLVLIVEAEPAVRSEVRETLESAGYDVLEADDGGRAIELINEGENPLLLDVVITDIDKNRGMEAISYFKSQYPHVPQIVLTGFLEQKRKSDSGLKIAILGGGKGGSAMLELFSHLSEVEVIGINDKDPNAPGIQDAKNMDIPVFDDPLSLISQSDLQLIIDVTGSPTMGELLVKHKSTEIEVLGGAASKLLWTIVQHEKDMQAQLFQSQNLAGMVREGINGFLIKPLAKDRLIKAVASAMEEREIHKL